ncbi:MAG TPA: TIGR04282 family arsenosugar biosynthesis glycosyltransferase [Candidatus Polarisedimenticolia bacterium]|nr:TIGR04282 family arsenosugar biosynthesis glycosyltransferase [Candidatus Polarisedimenticolia bacterium]
MRPPALVLYARAPHEGAVKTRLIPWLDPEEALELHLAMLEDSLRLLRLAAARSGAAPFLSPSEPWEMSESGPGAGLAAAAAGLTRLPQEAGDLGVRLDATLSGLLKRGHAGVAIFGSDSPTLPPERPGEALSLLAGGAEAVLGPAEDGGFYLIAARRVVPGMLEGITWGGAAVLQQTIGALARAGVRPALLPDWYDVDRPADLERLLRDLRSPGRFVPERTAAFVSALEGAGRLPASGAHQAGPGRLSRPGSSRGGPPSAA